MLILITFYILADVMFENMTSETMIRIAMTKTLSSGKSQVKFTVEEEDNAQYGYLLVSEPKPVGDILEEIKHRLEKRRAEMENINPFFPVLPMEREGDFLLFSA